MKSQNTNQPYQVQLFVPDHHDMSSINLTILLSASNVFMIYVKSISSYHIEAIILIDKRLDFNLWKTHIKDSLTCNYQLSATITLTQKFIYLFNYSLAHLLTHSFTHSLPHSHSLTHSFTHSPIYSLPQSLNQVPTPLLRTKEKSGVQQ